MSFKTVKYLELNEIKSCYVERHLLLFKSLISLEKIKISTTKERGD